MINNNEFVDFSITRSKPVLRYPGGKSKLLSFLVKYLPEKDGIKGKYIEPFVGGGAVYFHIQPYKASISDLNKELIDLYKGIKNYPHKIWDIYSSFPSGKISYYKIRDEDYSKKPMYYRAAKTLYLNRTCFKGMWRHNLNGDFNVGYGGDERRWAINHKNIIELSKLLKNASIDSYDFIKALEDAGNGDFIFLDPPYKPGEKEMDHGHYINGKFSFADQERLAEALHKLSLEKDVKWVMTNTSHDSIKELYKDFIIRPIPKGTSKQVGVFTENPNEILISNY